MALGDSAVSICNIGLVSSLGQDPIKAFTQDRKAAILCNERYEAVRRACLRVHPWNFARSWAQLAKAVTQPPFGTQTAFQLPVDFIRLANLPDRLDGRESYQIMGRTLLSEGASAGPLNLVYIYDCKDASLFDPLFVEVLGYAMAAELCEPLAQSQTKKASALRNLQDKLSSARTVGSQDGSSDEWDVDVLLGSRA